MKFQSKTVPKPDRQLALLQILARAFVPDKLSNKLPPEYLAAMTVLETELTADMDLDYFSPEGEESEEGGSADALGFRRLAAATALLRLARLHDSRLHVLPYYKLAFTMQASFFLIHV